jgi:hypothetical protein
MKYLKKYKLFESLIDKKIQLLKDLALELEDAGLQVEVINGGFWWLLRDPRVSIHTGSRYTDDYKKFIIMKVTDDNERFDTDLYNTEIIDEFKETLKSYGMNPRSMSGGRNFCVFKFDKHGHMTNSPIIRESKSNREILDNIEEIFREIEDIGFSVECHKNIDGSDGLMEADDELMRIWIEKFDVYGFSDENRDVKYYPTQDFVNALLHLTSYVIESNLDYRIEIVDNSQVVDVISTESEIENMINWKEPIDYIKIIVSYKDDDISESLKPEYDTDWKKPGNPIREMLEVDIREILLEITDLGYRPQLSGFTKGFSELIIRSPYVWICNQKRLSHDDFWNEINDTIERVKDYLSEKGFNVYQDIINEGSRTEQVYIYFNIGN